MRGSCAKRRASMRADADSCRTRTCNVRMPRISSAASKGASTAPRLVRMRAAFSNTSSFRAKASAPARTSEWPLRYLVAECMTMSAPSASGRVRTGVATVESTPSSAPASCAIDATAAMSLTPHMGLAGVSIHTILVWPRRTAARIASGLVASTNVASMPSSRASSASHFFKAQYMTSGATTCVGLASARNAEVAAAMPEPNIRHASAPSRACSTASACRTVGVSGRP